MVQIEIITIIVAIYGAILSSIALTWHILSYIFDKPRIIPRYSTGFIRISEGNIQYIFSISLSNPTKHRIVVSSAGISFKNNQDMIFVGMNDGFPKTLLQGDSHTIYRDIDVIKEAIDEQGAPDCIWVKDATGKKYKGSIKKMIGNVNAMHRSKHSNTN